MPDVLDDCLVRIFIDVLSSCDENGMLLMLAKLFVEDIEQIRSEEIERLRSLTAAVISSLIAEILLDNLSNILCDGFE